MGALRSTREALSAVSIGQLRAPAEAAKAKEGFL